MESSTVCQNGILVIMSAARGGYKGGTNSQNISATADEVLQYQAKQYVSSMEATWRILDYPIMGNKPAIMRLPIHLENQ